MILSFLSSRLPVNLALLLLLAACGSSQPAEVPTTDELSPAPEWRRGVFPSPSAIAEVAPPERPASLGEKEAFAAKVTAICPAGTDNDPLPGLSPPARSIKPLRHRAYRSRPVMQEEIKGLLRLLAGMAPNDPDRPKVLDRLASNYFEDERDIYRDCLSLLVMLEADRWPLSQLEARLNDARGRFLAARANGFAACKRLAAEHPSYSPTGLCAAQNDVTSPHL